MTGVRWSLECTCKTETRLTSSIFWGVTRRIFMVIYRRFRATYRSHLQESTYRHFEPTYRYRPLKMGRIGCPETSVNKYQFTPRNIPEDWRYNLRRSGSLKLRTDTVLPSDIDTTNYIIWFQTLSVFWMLYYFFWVIPRRLNFIYWRFGTFCLFHVHSWCKQEDLLISPMNMEQSVPKRRA